MNEQDRSELDWLKRRQSRLLDEAALLAKRLESIESRLNQAQPEVQKAQPLNPAPLPTNKPRTELAPEPKNLPAQPIVRQAPRIPPIIQPAPVSPQAALPQQPAPRAEQITSIEPSKAPATPSVVLPPATQTPPPRTTSKAESPSGPSFEMRLGTYWLVRIGIVMLLTGLVFFGNYAYQNFVANLGAGGKVTLLYLASAILLGAGAWWQRAAAKPSLKNYAQVLFAGGLAAVYFTTYAAHHFEPLRIIQTNWVDGILLLAWAGFIVWIADRKKSEVMALFAVLLAYYTAVITNAGLFTLYSNLVLTLAAVFFFVRNRWAILSFVSLGATYGAYGFWRFFNGLEWHWATPEQGLWTGVYFLVGYWVLFTAAVFLSRHEKFIGESRASFLTINNGAFFTMFLLTMYQVHQGGFWKFALVYGGILLGLAALARRVLSAEPLAKNTYLTQGLLLATTGIISHPKLGGLNLAFVLAVESVTLLMAGQFRKNWVLLIGGYVAAALAVAWGMDGMLLNDRHGLWRGMGLGALMLWNAIWMARGLPAAKKLLRPQVGYFVILALAVWFAATYDNCPRENLSLLVAAEAALLIFSIYLLRVREISLLAQGYLMLAQCIWMFDTLANQISSVWWNPSFMLVLTTALTAWWNKQKVMDVQSQTDPDWQALLHVPQVMQNLVFFAGASFAIRLAGGWQLAQTIAVNPASFYAALGLGALFLGHTLLAHRQTNPGILLGLRLQPAYSTALALLVWLAAVWHHSSPQSFPLILAVTGMLLTLSIYWLRVPEISFLSQGYLILAQIAWLAAALNSTPAGPWWNPALLLAITLGISHWWQKQQSLKAPPEFKLLVQSLYALALIGIVHYWIRPHVEAPTWLALTALLGVGITAYGVATRAWLLAAFAQIFVLLCGTEFLLQLLRGKPDWRLALVPMAALSLLSWSAIRWFEQRPSSRQEIKKPLLQLALLYRWAALVMTLWWVAKYVPEREWIWVYASLGFLAFLWAGWRKSSEALLFGAVFSIASLLLFWVPLHDLSVVYFPNFLALLALLIQQRLVKRWPDRYNVAPRVQAAVIIAGSLSLWLLVHRWVLQSAGGYYLTASWSVLALVLFTCGILVHERVYRWIGLSILAAALGRIVIFDVWQLKTVYRILSFMALGIVLLVLGFIYNKYQEKLKEWL